MILFIIFLIACGCLYLLQREMYKKIWDRGLSVRVGFSSGDVFEGEYAELTEQIENKKPLPLPYVRLSYKLSERLVFQNNPSIAEERASFFVVGPNKAVTKKTKLLCSKRGYYLIGKAEVSSADIFYSRFFEKQEDISSSIAVYPKATKIDEYEVLYKRILGDTQANRFILPDPFEFKGIREYQPYDSFRQINFKAWAKSGQLMSNTYGYTVSQRVRLFLNLQKYSEYQRGYVYESAIRLTAYLAEKYISEKIPTGLTCSGKDAVTGEPGSTGSGASRQSLRDIYEVLARTEVNGAFPVIDFLKQAKDEDIVVLVSPYYDEALCEEYRKRTSGGGLMYWILPRSSADKGVPLAGKNIIVWEVEPEYE